MRKLFLILLIFLPGLLNYAPAVESVEPERIVRVEARRRGVETGIRAEAPVRNID